jgi:hypothetical protein
MAKVELEQVEFCKVKVEHCLSQGKIRTGAGERSTTVFRALLHC